MIEVVIYTDGACSPNPGPGGFGVLILAAGGKRELSGGEQQTTNNRMEMMAAIVALESLDRPCQVRLHTDSQYLRDGITAWVAGWQRRGWRTKKNEPVKNADLWRRLLIATEDHEIEWVWVRGHSGDPGNERADELARIGATSLARPYHAARVDRPSWMWSQRDWAIFRAACAQTQTPRQRLRAVDVVTRFRGGEPVSSIAERGVVSRQYVYQMLAAEELRDARVMGIFYAGRRNLGRPIDLGGPRDEWVESDVIDELDER